MTTYDWSPGAIETERLTLVPLRVGHAAEMAAVLSDPALHTFIGGAPLSEAELSARYARMTAGSPEPGVFWLNWVLSLAGGELAGTVQATVTPGERGPVAEIAWVIGTPWQGRGLATEAARALVRWLGARGAAAVIAHVHPGHAASAAVARACGLTPTDVRVDGEVRLQLTGPGVD